jgi:hypothetical protein
LDERQVKREMGHVFLVDAQPEMAMVVGVHPLVVGGQVKLLEHDGKQRQVLAHQDLTGPVDDASVKRRQFCSVAAETTGGSQSRRYTKHD